MVCGQRVTLLTYDACFVYSISTKGGYMGMPVVDDEDSDDSVASGHLVIETMGLQGQKARSSVEELDQDYMPSAMDDML